MAFKLVGKIHNTKDANKRAAAHKTAKSIFKEIRNKMNEYRETFGQDITEQWLNQSFGGLQLTPTRAERLKARKEIEKMAKREIQAGLVDTDFENFTAVHARKRAMPNTALTKALKPNRRQNFERKNKDHTFHWTLTGWLGIG